VGDVMDGDTAGRLAPFLDRQLIELSDGVLSLAASALPYARTIAAIFDPYRVETARKFSAAV
jgi:oxygen-independent coproporphyrinogen III oxidase